MGEHRGGLAIELRLSGGGPPARPVNALPAASQLRLGGPVCPRRQGGGLEDAGRRPWEDLRDGLPQGNTYFGVLRQAMATDRLEPAGVYFGTSTGALFASADEGDSWTCVAQHLPTILSVETLVVEA
jgi:hypothetical protein